MGASNPALQKPSLDVMAGEPFGKYVLVKRLAIGGMAEVSLARLTGAAGFNKLVVIKQVLPGFAETPSFVEMFLDEARLAAKLSHPNIAQTFELGEEAGRHYIAMEYVPGESLYAILRRCREKGLLLPMACTLRVTMQLLEALDYAHALHDESGLPLKLVHRDVTPSNVMVTEQGGIKLLDFGIARAATQLHHTEVGRVKGKGGYMAPEQCRTSNVDNRADIYGAGAVLYLMATGMKPFEHLPPGSDLMAQMTATIEGAFKRPHELKRDINPELERIILKAMALKPDDRYQTAGEMLGELEKFAAAISVFPSPRELGEFVRKLFPKEAEGASDTLAESSPSSPRATPPPQRAEVTSATQDTAAELEEHSDPAGTTLASEDDEAARRQAPTNPARSKLPAGKPFALEPWMIAAGGAVAVLIAGILLARIYVRTSEAPEPAPEPPAAPVAKKVEPPPAVVAAPAPVASPAPQPPPEKVPEPAVETKAPEPVAKSEPAHAPSRAPPPAPKPTEPKPIAAVRPPGPVASPPAPAKEEPVKKKHRATGTLQLNAYPWAKVRVQGRERGITPLRLELPAGDYAVELENPVVNVKRTLSLSVREGQETTHFEKLTP